MIEWYFIGALFTYLLFRDGSYNNNNKNNNKK